MSYNAKAKDLLADIRELTVDMHSHDYHDRDCSFLVLCRDILRQVKADGVPMHPIYEYVTWNGSIERDNDRQLVLYTGEYPEPGTYGTLQADSKE